MRRWPRKWTLPSCCWGHPSKSSDFSGSTSWEGGVRSRWDLKRTDDSEDGDKTILGRTKSNYAPLIDVKLRRLTSGVLVPADPEPGSQGPAGAVDLRMREDIARKVILTALDVLKDQKRAMSHSPSARNFLPRVMLAAGLGEGFNKVELTRAMEGLFARKAILADQQLWRGGDRHWVAGVAAATWSDEAEVGADEPQEAGSAEAGADEPQEAGSAEVGADEPQEAGSAEVGADEPQEAGSAEAGADEPQEAGSAEAGADEPQEAGSAEAGADEPQEAGSAEAGADEPQEAGSAEAGADEPQEAGSAEVADPSSARVTDLNDDHQGHLQ